MTRISLIAALILFCVPTAQARRTSRLASPLLHAPSVLKTVAAQRVAQLNTGAFTPQQALPLIIDPTTLSPEELQEIYEDVDAWGMHTVINLKACNPETIRSKEALHEYVCELCELIKMKRYGEPRIVHFGECETVAGYTLDQLIETSNVMGHFANNTNHAYLDIFSCKPYSAYEAVLFTKEYFAAVESHAITMLR